jgi:hypothetical protein
MDAFVPSKYRNGGRHLFFYYITERNHVPFRRVPDGLEMSICNAYKCKQELMSRMPKTATIRWFNITFLQGVKLWNLY